MTLLTFSHTISNASQGLISPEILSNPLLLRHFELVMQAVEKGETERLNNHLRLSNAAIEKGLSLTEGSSPARFKPFPQEEKKPFKPYTNSFMRSVMKRTKEREDFSYDPAHFGFADTMDYVRRLLDKEKSSRGFITLNHKNLARGRGISLRTAKAHIALAKEMSLLDIHTVRNHIQGRRMVVKKGIDFCDFDGLKNRPQSQSCSAFDKKKQSAKFDRVKCKIDAFPYKSTRVRAFLNPLHTTSMSLPLSCARRRDEKSPERKKKAIYISRPIISKAESASNVISLPSPKPRFHPPLPTKAEAFAEQAYALFQTMVLANLSYPVKIHPKTFSNLLNSLRKSHFPTLEAVKAYFGKVAVNPFLMGLKPNKDGNFWRIQPEHLFSGKIIEQSWADAGYFNVYASRTSIEEGDDMGRRKELVRLSDLTLGEVIATAKTSIDLNIKTALFQKLGSDTYKSWFHDNSFVFGGQNGAGLQFVVDGLYTRKVILERYLYLMQETLDKLKIKSCGSQLIEEETLKKGGLNADRDSEILQ